MNLESLPAAGRFLPALLLANVLFFAFATLPTLSRAEALRGEERGLLETREQARRSASRGQQSARNELVARVRKAERHLVGERDLPALADRIRKNASTAGLEVQHIDYRSTREPRRAYGDLQITLTAQGPYRALKALLCNLDGAETALALRSLSVLGNDDLRSGSRRVQLAIGTFMLP